MSKDDALYEMVEARYPLFTRELQRELKRVQHKNNGSPLCEENICEVAQALSEDLYAFIKSNAYFRFEDDSRLLCHHGRLKLTERGLKHISKYIHEAFEYRSNLRNMSFELFDGELKSFRQERDFAARQRSDSEDRYAFFNDEKANARFDYWLSIPVWTIDEAVALSLGKDPDVVSTTTLRSFSQEKTKSSLFFKEYEQRSRQLERTVSNRIDFTPLRAFDFITWALANFAHVPQQFRSGLASLRRDREEANAQDHATADIALDDMDPKNRRTLRLMILCMAIDKYGHRIDGGRSPATKAIQGAFIDAGLSADLGTIKQVLDDAAGDQALQEEIKIIRKAMA